MFKEQIIRKVRRIAWAVFSAIKSICRYLIMGQAQPVANAI